MIQCDYCGRQNPDEAMNCSGCASQLREPPPVVKQTKAGFWIRFAARFIDFAFLGFIGFFVAEGLLVALMLAGRRDLISEDGNYASAGLGLMPVFCFIFARFLYQIICEAAGGITLGKLCCGLRVVRQDGSPCTVRGAFIRNLAYVLDSQFLGGVGYTSMKNSPLNQRYGDVWGKTAVIKSREMSPESKRGPAHLACTLAFGVFIYAILFATGLLLKIWEASDAGSGR